MSFASAAALLVGASLRNRARRLVKQPRQLVFLLVGGAYFFMTGAVSSRARSAMAVGHGQVPPWLALFLLGYLIVVWVFGGDDAVLTFTEAEVDFFFTAPVSRRQLVHYKIVRTILASLVSGAVFAFGLRRGGAPVYATIGFCLAFSTISLHRVCASMTRASLLAYGLSAFKRRLVTLTVVAVVVVAMTVSLVRSAMASPSFELDGAADWLVAGSTWSDAHATALAWALFPAVAMARVIAATSAAEFFAALPVASLVFGVHYVWALSTDVAFEESSAEAARKRATRLENLRAGRMGAVPRTPPLFRLGATGAPWVAIFWKNLVAGMRISRQQLAIWAIAFGVLPFAIGAFGARHSHSAPGWIALGIAVFLTIMGPQMMRNDLRQDIDQMDILRSYPLPARDVVLGELLAPFALLVALEWGLLAIAIGVGLVTRGASLAAVATGCALGLPAITACMLVLRNLGALWLPTWAGASAERTVGIEAFGQRLLVLFGTIAALGIVMAPAGLAAAGLGVVLWPWIGMGVVPVGGAVTAGVGLAEAYVGLVVAGRAFERFDVGRQ